MVQKTSGSKSSEKILLLFTILLFCKEKQSLSMLSEKLGCSKQTVLRIIPVLEKFGGGRIFEEKRGKQSFYWLEKNERLTLNLSHDGLKYLMLCKNFLSDIMPRSITTEMLTTLMVASDQVNDDSFCLEKYSSIGATVNKGYINYSKFNKQYDTLTHAIAEKLACTVSYTTKGNQKISSLAPVNLINLNGCIYLYAYIIPRVGEAIPKYEKALSLALHNICEVKIEERKFNNLPIINNNDFGILQGERIRARVKFNEEAKEYIVARIWSENQEIEEIDGNIVLNFVAANKYELISWILSFGVNAELLEPLSIREEIKVLAMAMVQQYKKNL